MSPSIALIIYISIIAGAFLAGSEYRKNFYISLAPGHLVDVGKFTIGGTVAGHAVAAGFRQPNDGGQPA